MFVHGFFFLGSLMIDIDVIVDVNSIGFSAD